jgi:hypothetical protein
MVSCCCWCVAPEPSRQPPPSTKTSHLLLLLLLLLLQEVAMLQPSRHSHGSRRLTQARVRLLTTPRPCLRSAPPPPPLGPPAPAACCPWVPPLLASRLVATPSCCNRMSAFAARPLLWLLLQLAAGGR